MTRTVLLAVLGLVALGCPEKPAPQKRVNLERTGGTTFRLIPTEGQLPYCLAYTVNMAGLTRQLTMSRLNVSHECPAGRPIGKHPFKVPLDEGPVKVHLIFTSQPVNAGSVSQQLMDSDNQQVLKVMNMRLPGNAAIETLDFLPEEDTPAEVGGLVGQDAGGAPAPAGDAGTP
ncbi:MAG: hypothetical protein AMXMBFR34_20510 [Myxococcaceae bacterium]